MPLKVNGTTIPTYLVVPAIVAVFWLGGLSLQVTANAEEIGKQSETPERLVKIETTLKHTEEKLDDLKTSMKEARKESKEQLRLILEAVKK